MSEQLGRIIVAGQVVFEGTIPPGSVANVRFEKGAKITANTASGPVPTGRTHPDVTVVEFGPKATAKKRKPAARKPAAKRSSAKKSSVKKK